MPRYYCDYCDTYLTHDSPSVRKQHNAGYKHKANVRTYYQQFEEQQTQSLIDQRVKEHLESKVAGFHQHVGAPTHQSYSLGYKPPISVPVLQPPSLPLPTGPPGSSQPPLLSTIRPPVLPPPTGITGYGPPPTFRPGVAPLPTPAGPPQANGAVRPPTLTPPGAPGVRSLAPPPQSVSGVMPGLPAGPPGLYQQQPPQQSQQPQQQQSGQRSTAPSGAGYSGFSYGPPGSAGGYVQQRQGAPSVPSGPSGNYNPPSAVPGQSSFNYGQPPAGMTLPAQVASNSYGPSPGGPVAYRT